MQIAVDGPAGSGKSTISKIVAHNNDLIYIDTGAMYRAVAWLFIKNSIDLNADKYKFCDIINKYSFIFKNNGAILHLKDLLSGEEIDVTSYIRSKPVADLVSSVASIKEVREILVYHQQQMARVSDSILDGRDIGTVVLPHANFKFFLTAAPEKRAERRAEQLNISIGSPEYTEILNNIIKRDHMDSTRELSPLVKSIDAIEIDSTELTISDVVTIIDNTIKGVI